mgnify:CR=1 FL=1
MHKPIRHIHQSDIDKDFSEKDLEKFEQARIYIDQVMNGKKVNKILFVNPPDVDENVFTYDIAKRGRANNYPAYGLGVLSAQLRKLKYNVKICNLNHEVLKKVYHSKSKEDFNFIDTWQKIITKEIEKFKPDVIGVSCLFSVTHISFKKVCEFIKFNYKSTPIFVGGVHVSHDIYGVVNDLEDVDFFSLFEGDLALPNLLDVINKKKDTKELAQFAFKTGGEIYIFDKRLVPDGDDMSILPAYDIMDIKDHSKYGTIGSWHGLLGQETVVSTAQSNRGCRAACTFCNVRTYHGKKVRHKTVDSVVDELLCLQNDYGIEHIVWLDDDLLKDEKRTIHMFNEMVRRNVKLTWDATNGVIAHSLKKFEVVDAAYRSGCVGLHVGIESGNPNILRQIRKPGTVETFLEAAEVLNKFPSINSRALLMLGFPKETLSMIFDTIELAEKINFDWNNLSILQPWKGTPIYEEMSDDGLIGMEEGTLKTDDNDKAPYQLGTYSRQRSIEMGKIVQKIEIDTSEGFLHKIKAENFDIIPSAKNLDDLWFYMNIRINLSKLLRENRVTKIKQQYNFLNYVCNKTAPDNALIIYFFALMQKKYLGYVTNEIRKRLKDRLEKSEYWQERFTSFQLDIEHLINEKFPEYISDGGVPKGYVGDTRRFQFPTHVIN